MDKKTGGHRQTEMDSAGKKLKYHLKRENKRASSSFKAWRKKNAEVHGLCRTLHINIYCI